MLIVGYWISCYYCAVVYASSDLFTLYIYVLQFGCIYVCHCYILLMNWLLNHYMMTFIVLFTVFDLKPFRSKINIAISALFVSICMEYLFFHSFSLWGCFKVKTESHRQHIVGAHFFIHSASLYVWLENLKHLHSKQRSQMLRQLVTQPSKGCKHLSLTVEMENLKNWNKVLPEIVTFIYVSSFF